MRLRYSYIEYEYSPKATFYSRIVGIISTLVSIITFICMLALIMGLYDGIVKNNWDSFLPYIALGEVICIGYFLFISKVIRPRIQKVARKDTEAVFRGIKRPEEF